MLRDLSQFFACVILFFSAVSGWCCFFFSFFSHFNENKHVGNSECFPLLFLGVFDHKKYISYPWTLAHFLSSTILGKDLFHNRGRFCRGIQVFTCRRGSFLNFAMLTFFISSVSFSPTWRILMKPVMFDRLNFFPRNISWAQHHVQNRELHTLNITSFFGSNFSRLIV